MALGMKSISKTMVWILMGMLIVGLAGFGAVNFSGSVTSVALVGDQEIDVQSYARELQREQNAVQAQTGQAMPMSQMRELGLDRVVLSRLITLAALDHEVAELGLSIGDENVQREILEIDAFQDIQGNFDREAYRYQLDQIGLSEVEFETDLRSEAARTLVQGAILTGVQMPHTLIDTLTDYIGARRSFTWTRVTPEDVVLTQVMPSDADLRAFYESNPDQFTLPETKQITYARLTPDMLVDQVELDETALRELYDQRADLYQTPERRLVERLVFADDAAASNAMAQIEVNGTNFDLLVEQRGLTLSDVDLGDVTLGDLGAAGEAIFAAQVGDVVGPLPSDLGAALFRVNGRFDARTTTFEQAEPELREELASERARRLVESQAENIDDLLAGGATLEELGDETDLALGKIDWTADSNDGIAAYSAFRSIAEAVQPTDFPTVEFLEDGGLFALRLDSVLPPRPEPFEDAKAKVLAAVQADRLTQALTAEADRILADLVTSGDFLATGLPVKVENGLTRTAFIDNAPADLMTQVFDMEPGDLRIVQDREQVLIVQLDEALPPEQTDDLTQLTQALQIQVNQALGQALFTAYATDAQMRASPRVDQQALNAVAASFQ
ncbi:SurA N-terminal domain-containing protein [Rhodobacteraceae bacterium M382]|nr:SurA N-terminal domain-containing protein [Rhodobacteraceae bacterium M382]